MKSITNLLNPLLLASSIKTALSIPLSSNQNNNLPNCNDIDKNLVGHFEPDTTYYDFDELKSKDYSLNLDENGCYKPNDCIPEENLLVIVPFRNREQHLNILLNNLHPLLQKQKLSYCILVSEQYDQGKFNKGLLMNSAFKEAKSLINFDCIVLHDVDMLPENDKNMYKCSNYDMPVHLSPKISKYNYVYPYGTDFGGVTMMTKDHYNKVNGHTNMFWGWGKEDADMEYRIAQANLKIKLPTPIDLGKYTMLTHNHVATWQNEGVTIGIEDDRSTSLKKTLMGMKEQRNQYDGLNSLKYTIKNNINGINSLYSKITIDVRKTETISNELIIGGYYKNTSIQYQTIINPNDPITCKYYEFPNSYVGTKYIFKDFKPSETINVTACDSGCSGFSKLKPSSSRHFAFSYPILQTNANSTVYLKQCKNDLNSWQIIPKGIIIPENTNENNFQLKFKMKKLVNNLGKLYYRDSWVYEGQRYLTNNLPIDQNNEITKIDNNNEIILKNEIDINNNTITTITVNLNIKVAKGNYMIFSKIVDSFGQPIAELNWFTKMTGGSLNPLEFKEENTINSDLIKDKLEAKGENENVLGVNFDSADTKQNDIIYKFKGEMKQDFKIFTKLANYNQNLQIPQKL